MVKFLRIFLLILIVSEVSATDIATLESRLESAEGADRMETLNELSLKYQIRNPVKALEYGFEGIRLAEAKGNRQMLGKLTNTVGLTYVYQSNYQKSSDYLLRSLKIFRELNDRKGEAQATFDMANMYKMFGNEYDTAITYYKKAYEVFLSLNDSSKITNSLNGLGIVYTEAGDYKTGEQYFLSMLETARKYEQQNFEATAMKQLGWHFYNQGRYDKSAEWYEQAARFELGRGNSEGYAGALVNLAYIYLKIGDVDKAIEANTKCLEIYEQSDNPARILQALRGKVYILLHQKAFKEVIPVAERGVRLSNELGKPTKKLTMYKYLHQVYDSLQMPLQSLAKYKLYANLNDSLHNQNRMKKMAEARALFDLDLKNGEIASQKALLKYKSSQVWFLVAGIILITLISLLFIRKKSISLRLKAANEEIQQMRIEQMQKEYANLENDLEYKKRELISYSLNMVQKNNLISEIGEDLKSASLKSDEALRNTLRKIKSKTGTGARIDKNWENFRKRFEEINPEFFSTLLRQHPKLTPNELKICALASLNLSSKEIATVNEMTLHSLKVARYRIRKKLDMKSDQGFNEYFMVIGEEMKV